MKPVVKLFASLALASPWQDTLEAMTGSPEMGVTTIIDYFAPLMAYLEEQDKGRSCGW